MSNLVAKMNKQEELIRMDEEMEYYFVTQIIADSDREALDLFLEKGFNLNARGRRFVTAAFDLGYGELEFVRLLVEKGLNLNVIDIEGNTILKEVALSEKFEILEFALSQGIDPYQENFILVDTVSFFEESYRYNQLIPHHKIAEFIKEKTSFEKDFSLSYKSTFELENYELALSMVYKELSQLGGFPQLMKKWNTHSYKFLIRLHNTLILNKKYEDANLLMKTFYQSNIDSLEIPKSFPVLGLETALMTGDSEAFQMYYEFYNSRLEGRIREDFEYKTLTVTNEFDGFPYITATLTGKGRVQIQNSLFASEFFDLALNDPSNRESLLEALEGAAYSKFKIVVDRIKYLYYLGMLFVYEKKWTLADYFFEEVIKSSHKENTYFQEYVSSRAMIDFVKEKREG